MPCLDTQNFRINKTPAKTSYSLLSPILITHFLGNKLLNIREKNWQSISETGCKGTKTKTRNAIEKLLAFNANVKSYKVLKSH